MHIGSLLSRGEGAVPIALDAASFTSTHLAIIASTGSGKSYLAGVILEELMRPCNRAAVLRTGGRAVRGGQLAAEIAALDAAG